MKFHELDNKFGKKQATEMRRKKIEEMLNIKLEHLSKHSIDSEGCIGKNIENMIGAVQIPVGVAGPLKVNGKDYYLPLATTEGALVASVNRGCRAISEVTSIIFKDEQTRASCFKVKNITEAKKLADWVSENFEKVKEAYEKGQEHVKLLKIKPYTVGTNVFLRYSAFTFDAMGMNMVTIGAQGAGEFIERETGAKFVAVSGNMCIDKKPAAINFLKGRAKSVAADALIPREVVEKVLKTTPEDFVEINLRKNFVGSARAGSLGFNAHFANILKALFNATGQDLAHVVDGSIGITWAEVQDGNLYVSVTLPDLQVGTVGGGTRIETAQECLKILGVKNAKELAEVVAGAVLAGEVSLIAAIASHRLTSAHEELGR